MAENLVDWLVLLSVPGLGPAAFAALVARFGSPSDVLAASSVELRKVANIGPRTVQALAGREDETWASEQLRCAEETGARVLTLTDDDYPQPLRQIYAPPPVLFVRGEPAVCQGPAIALVGSRAFTAYGKETAHRLAADLVRRGITVVSGMALGTDTHAHRGALDQNGRTVAVLGCGLDRPYPARNTGMYHRICETGAAVSEFPFGTSPEPHHFPRRNRIISGLSLGVVVIEAGERSGALLTAQHAVDQNREVFAVPGPIHSGKSVGTNRLIKQGAVLVQTAEDILSELDVALRDHPAAQTPAASPRRGPPEEDLTADERRVFTCLSVDAPLPVDTISEQSGLSAPSVLSLLLGLELAGWVRQLPGKNYVRTSL